MSVKIIETNLDFTSLSERSITNMIVLHHTGGNDIDASAEQIHEWHKNNKWAGIGYHYVIRKDGTIERGRPEWAIGSHAYGENSHTIGIHISGDFDSSQPTEKQIENCAELVADICTRYGIPIDRAHIVGHGELMATSCPGTNLQMLLDNGVITGKANYYANPKQNEGTESVDGAVQEGTRIAQRFNTVDSCPEWARDTVKKMVDKGLLTGKGLKDDECYPADLDLSLDMLRVFVINDRAGLY